MQRFEIGRYVSGLTIAAAFLVIILSTASGQAQLLCDTVVAGTLEDCMVEYDAAFEDWDILNDIGTATCTNSGGGFSLAFVGTPNFLAIAAKAPQGGTRSCTVGTGPGAACIRYIGLSGSEYSKWKRFVKNTCLDAM